MRTLFVIKVYIQTEDMMGILWRKKNEVSIFCTVANRSDESEYFQIAAAFFQWWMRSNYKSLPAASWECCLVPALLFFLSFFEFTNVHCQSDEARLICHSYVNEMLANFSQAKCLLIQSLLIPRWLSLFPLSWFVRVGVCELMENRIPRNLYILDRG